MPAATSSISGSWPDRTTTIRRRRWRRSTVVVDGRGTANDVFALAELSFLYADDGGGRSAYLAAAVDAYAFLFPNGADRPPSPFDPRVRVATDIYNRALTSAFEDADGHFVMPQSGVEMLPFGTLELTFDPAELGGATASWSSSSHRRVARQRPAPALPLAGYRRAVGGEHGNGRRRRISPGPISSPPRRTCR